MKKLLALLLVFAMLFSLTALLSGCDDKPRRKSSSNSSSEDRDDSDSDDSIQGPQFDEEAALAGLKVEEYRYQSTYDYYSILFVENTTDFDQSVEISIEFFDGSNNSAGSDFQTRFIAGGAKVAYLFRRYLEFARVEYTLSPEEPYQNWAGDSLSWESVSSKNGEIVTVTNEGEKDAENVTCTIIFWSGDEIVDVHQPSLNTVKAGKSKSTVVTCTADAYDAVDVYVSGYAAYGSGNSDFDEEAVISQLQVSEYRYQDSDEYHGVLVIENQSDYDLDLEVYVEFYNDSNKLIATTEASVSSLGSGTQNAIEVSADEKFARIEYDLSAEQTYRSCMVEDLQWESQGYGRKEIITVKNEGSAWLYAPYCTALFWNDGAVVDVQKTSFWELAPGKEATMEVVSDGDYDSVELFWSAEENEYADDTDDYDERDLKVEEYRYKDYSSYAVAVEIENTGSEQLQYAVAVKFYNASNQLIGAAYEYEMNPAAPGTKKIFIFEQDYDFARIEYELFADISWSEGAADALEWTINPSNKTITVTNCSEREISSPFATILFWEDGNVVGSSVAYFSGDAYYMEPGETRTDDYYFSHSFDEAVFYWDCRYSTSS